HGIEHARFAERAAAVRAPWTLNLVGTVAVLALTKALHEWIVELFDMARRFPYARRRDQCRVEQLHIVAPLEVRPDPGVADVVFEQRAKRAEIVGVGETAVDLGAGENEAAALAQSDQLLQVVQLSYARCLRGRHPPMRVTN